ncbi:hypothetical protein TCAL_15615, partial [Tigriopus californicus]
LAFDCQGGNQVTQNPIGTCVCEGQLYVTNDCSEGFYCIDTLGNGCHKVCNGTEILVASFEHKHWSCESREDPVSLEKALRICPGAFNVCPSDNIDPPPNPDNITENPLGTCRCNGELWVSEGCSYGFYCNDTMDIGGEMKACGEGEVLLVDLTTSDWYCSNETDKCPGGPINGIGCPIPLCRYSQNHLGNCSCDGQLFLGDNCDEGFFCSTNIPDPYLFDGCRKSCLSGQILVPDIPNRDWSCKDLSETNFRCSGEFNLECPSNSIDGGLTSEDCNCSSEIIVSADCRELLHCSSKFNNGSKTVKCDEGTIVEIDLETHSYGCTENIGKCPGMGGFRLGCRGEDLPEPPELKCEFSKNPLGQCGGCEGQIFVNENCTEAFYCSFWTPEDGQEGCHKQCSGGQIVQFDLLAKNWTCTDRPEGFICPGKFQVDCQDKEDFDIQCGCPNEVWLNQECNAAFICEEKRESLSDPNRGKYVSCPPGRIIEIDFQNPYNYTCTKNVEKCPGSFHFGCVGGDFGSLTTLPPPTTSTTTDLPSSSSSSRVPGSELKTLT